MIIMETKDELKTYFPLQHKLQNSGKQRNLRAACWRMDARHLDLSGM